MTRYSLIPASYVYLLRDGAVLLQLRQNTGYMDGYWAAGAAGHVEAGETAVDAAVRELREELGLSVQREDLVPSSVMHRTDHPLRGLVTPEQVAEAIAYLASAQMVTGVALPVDAGMQS